MKQGQFPAIIELSDFNGKNGFIIDGEATGSSSGHIITAVGDVNGDQQTDLFIGAPSYNNYTGRGYVVFGGAGVGSTGQLSLSSLNGTNGFRLDGEAFGDASSFSISGVGDFNGDGIADILIGASGHNGTAPYSVGRSYLIYGGKRVGATGLLSLSDLDGTNGFKLDGEASSDNSGYWTSAVGDVNGDGLADILIGAYGHNLGVGRCYVVFGTPTMVSNGGLLSLSNLDGVSGFKIDGEVTNDQSGHSVSLSISDDINGDGWRDILIGAPVHNNQAGRSYVVFGGPGIGSGGLLNLTNLTGVNGYKLDGETAGELSGTSLTATGDLNGDEQSDFAIGAYSYNNNFPGRIYVVFGGPKVGNAGLLPLSSLNGTNGFKVNGDMPGDYCGVALGGGDINGDHYSDLLLGAPERNNSVGSVYVVFGSAQIGNSGSVSLSNLNGVNGFKLNGETAGNQLGLSVSALGDINGDSIIDLLIGAPGYNSYTGRSYVLFGDVPPVLVNNSLVLSQWETVQLNSSLLAAWDQNHSNETLIFIPTNVQHGQFEDIVNPGILLANFTQQQIWNKEIQFVHDGSYHAPAYSITVRSEGIAWTGPTPAKVTFTSMPLPTSQFSSIIQLSDLNGFNGFKLDGEMAGDQSGQFVNIAGDLNVDGYDDIVISAEFASPAGKQNAGRAYVVFGGSTLGSNGLINLSELNGINGFKVDGESAGDHLSYLSSGIGDINGDGYDDLLLGAYLASPNGLTAAGCSYVIFGSPTLGATGSFALSSLNGVNGFRVNGEMAGDQSGVWGAPVGDVNGDGHQDFYIGARAASRGGLTNVGCSYILLGGSTIGKNGVINLSSLNGLTGFKLNGEAAGDFSGYVVGQTRDINKDGYSDILISAFFSQSQTGRSYVVYGGSTIGNSGVINLSSLNGTNGFKIYGETAGDQSGFISSGDINGDSNPDLMVGAWQASRNGKANAGRGYVIYGSPTLGSSGSFSLSSLNGANGFKMDGETAGDQSSFLISLAGDVNHDGFQDFLTSAWGHNNATGRSYVVFGGAQLSSDGFLNITSLNGMNGFVIDGEMSGDKSGSVRILLGDVNGDGYDDFLLGAPNASPGRRSQAGRSYVVFGDVSPVLVNNSLSIFSNETVLISSDNLAAYDINHDNQSLIFIPSNVQHGQFEWINTPGIAVTNFTQQNITEGQVQFVCDGSLKAPSYDITVRSPGIALTGPASAGVILFPQNSLVINQGQTVLLTSAMLNATQANGDDSLLIFNVSDVSHGHFGEIDFPDQSILSFYQQNITNQQVLFVHDGSTIAPAYALSVTNGVTVTSPLTAAIDFDVLPVLETNQLMINQGQTVILTADNLRATHNGSESPTLNFLIDDLQHGYFEWVTVPGQAILNFFQQNVTDAMVRFVHDQTSNAPAYEVAVSDSRAVSSYQKADVIFDATPVLINNDLKIGQGQTVAITANNLNATQPFGNDAMLIFIITNALHGFFNLVTEPTEAIFSVFQQNVTDGTIQFTHDDSIQPPSYDISVTDGRTTSASQAAVIDFDPKAVLINNTLRLYQGQCLSLTSENLYAEHEGYANPELRFIIDDINHGNFSLSSQPFLGNISFIQQEITDQSITFCHDGSVLPPSYNVSVSDGETLTAPNSSVIIFDVNPIIVTNKLLVSQGQLKTLSESDLLATQADVVSEILTFDVTEVRQGYFAKNTAIDKPINNFNQSEIIAGNIIFVPNNSSVAPSYQVQVSDGFAHSDISASVTFLVTRNNFMINQGELYLITPDALNITNNGQNMDVNWIVDSSIAGGQFELQDQPDKSIVSFTQSQVADEKIIFRPNGSSSSPTFSLTVNAGGISYGALNGIVDFATPPILSAAFLKITPPDTVQITELNLQARDMQGTPSNQLMFTVSDVHNTRFTNCSSLDLAIFNFTQQDIDNDQICFIDKTANIPAFMVSVSNGRMTCVGCPVAAEVVTPEDSSHSSLLTVILSTVGSVILFPLLASLLRGVIERKVKEHCSRRENTLDSRATNAILDQFRVGCCGILTRSQYDEYVAVVGAVVNDIKLNETPLRERWATPLLSDDQKRQYLQNIAKGTKEVLEADGSKCYRFFKGIFGSEISPDQIHRRQPSIVANIHRFFTPAPPPMQLVDPPEPVADELNIPLLQQGIQ